MEEGARNAGGVVKNRNSTGCLIVKKKVDGVGGYSGPDIVYTRKEKKRPRLVESDSESRDEELLELNRMWGSSQVSTSGGSRVKKGIAKGSEFARKKGVDFSRDDVFTEERNSLDVYDFDEYDDLDGADKKRFFDTQGSGRMFAGAKSATRRELGTGSGRPTMIKTDRKRSFLESTSGDKTIGGSSVDIKNKRKERFQSHSNEAIRLQGKNGVLKLMVKNKVGGPSIATKYEEVEGISISRSRELTQKKILNDPNSIGKMKPRNLLSSKDSEDSDAQSEESEEPAGVLLGNVKTSTRPTKRGRRTEVALSPESVQVSRSKEAKVKRGSGTEKQLLREKIRKMLVSAGWNIDYRPRRNRDYFDAVYINPAGTAYWSIIKAYDALQKQFEEEGPEVGGENTGVSLIPDDALSKLTRQTQKKLEKEMKRKNRENNLLKQKKKAASNKFVNDDSETDCTDSSSEEEKSCSFNKHSGTSKGRLHGNGRNQTGKGQEKIEKLSAASSPALHGRKTKKIGRCTLLVRNADKGMNSEGDSFVPYKGKRTILSWLIDSGTVKLSEKVCYMNRKRTRVMLEGWITRDGIHCGCCSKIQTVSKFEIHSASKLRQPYQNICLPSGVSLLQCQVNAWNSQGDSQRTGFNSIDVDGDDPNDDTCGICGDGGNLICCDGCPSTFHQSCVGIETLPSGDWHCSHCSCKFCGLADADTSQSDENTSVELLECSLCERKYHQACTPVMNSVYNNSSNQTSFCGRKCQELLEQLQKLLGVKHDLESGLSWSLIHRNDLDADPSHRGFSQKVEWNAKLAVALTVMDECFLPITDRRSGINLIQNVLYNCRSNFNRLNYGGFYTAILEKGDEIISAASIRIRGNQLAEMPFIGTRHIYRRQGMCRRLLVAIESALRILKVEKLVIPAISDMMHTWTKVFGFCALGESLKQEMKSLNMLVFPGTDMLQKKLVELVTSKRDVSASKGTDICKDDGGTSPLPDFSRVSDAGTSPSETSAGDPDPLPHNDVSIEKSDAGFNLPNSGVSLNDDCLPTLRSDVARDIQEPMECKVSQETGSSSELEDKSVKFVRDDVLQVECPSGASTHDIKASLERVENDGHENKGASALGGSSEAVDGSTIGSPGLVSDVEKPCSVDASHNTLLTGNPVFDSPPEKKEGAPSEINDKTAKVDSSLKPMATCPTPMMIHPCLDESTTRAEVVSVTEFGRVKEISDSTSEPSAPATTLTPLVCSDGTAEPVLQLEAERDFQVKASVSSNGALTPAVCSDSEKEEENTSLLCSAPDTELRSISSVQGMPSDPIDENTVEDAPGDGSTQISEG